MFEASVAGRFLPRVYRVAGKADVHRFLADAVEASGGRVIYASVATRSPIYFGVEFGSERAGLLCYPFRATQRVTKNRPADEHRLQIKYGAEETWSEDHPLAFDVAGVDTTLVLGVHLEAEVLIGLDPRLYDPLPMGISVEFKTTDVEQARCLGWHAWDRASRAGSRRQTARSITRLETLVGFAPSHFERYLRLEREATSLGLDSVLRLRAARVITAIPNRPKGNHVLEDTFHLSSRELLEIIASRKRLKVAVRGGVAEHHLLRSLQSDRDVESVVQADQDGPPDLIARLRSGRVVRIECKNGEASKYANGDGRVEVQKTRASKSDPKSRFYDPGQFDVLAVCLWPDKGRPRFVYRSTRDLARHVEFPDRLAVLHRTDSGWATRLRGAI